MQDISEDIHHQQYTFESKKNDFHNKYNYYGP